MVKAENNDNGKILLDSFGEEWSDVDKTLEESTTIMMSQQVILDNVTRAQNDTIM